MFEAVDLLCPLDDMKHAYEMCEKRIEKPSSYADRKDCARAILNKNIFIAIKDYVLSDCIFCDLSRLIPYIKRQYCDSEFNIEEKNEHELEQHV